MEKPPKTPRPRKGPIHPPRPDDSLHPEIGLLLERTIGRFVISWARLESTLTHFIWFCFDLDISRGRIITTNLGATRLIKMLRDIGQIELGEIHKFNLSIILDKVDILKDDRNLIVHGNWARNNRGRTAIISMRVKSEDPKYVVGEVFTRQKMQALVQTCDTLRLGLHRLHKECAALRNKPEEQHPEG